MNTTTEARCPMHAADAVPVTATPAAPANAAQDPGPAPPLQPIGCWPPGPPVALTGWSLLRQMSKDLLQALRGWQKDYGDLVHLRIWPEQQVVVMDPALVRELLVTHHDALIRWERGIDVFSQVHGHSVLTSEGAAWRTKRHALQPPFGPKPVQAFLPSIVGATGHALDTWRATEESWPIESALTSLTMEVIMRQMFSSAAGDDARAAEQAVHIVSRAADKELYWPASLPTWLPSQKPKRDAMRTLTGLIGRHIDQRLAQPGADWPDDLLSRLLHLHQQDPASWPLQAVRDECMTAFLAGHETTAATLTWWCWCMAAHPGEQAQVRHEIDHVLQGRAPQSADLARLPALTRTLQETLRLYPAAPVLLTRRCIQPITLGGWQLPARTLCAIPVHLLHHDPRSFPDPEAFRPARFGEGAPPIPRGAWLPFGTGPRVCLGQHLAMAEMTAIAAMLLQRYVIGIPPHMGQPKPVMNVSLRPAEPLHLTLQPRHTEG
ncbi:cytochrome P450 [Massilia arenosa]|uniref:Cytochrome P450 n=1 Tax=Zemynaea arenosa TaxID=2561931 RepID=A0A4Y9SAP6_9BURK|nr:cytochrome P450 [Massilia arenosa]TFW17226.1 cytochrome P450 [Massilia arenosa]